MDFSDALKNNLDVFNPDCREFTNQNRKLSSEMVPDGLTQEKAEAYYSIKNAVGNSMGCIKPEKLSSFEPDDSSYIAFAKSYVVWATELEEQDVNHPEGLALFLGFAKSALERYEA